MLPLLGSPDAGTRAGGLDRSVGICDTDGVLSCDAATNVCMGGGWNRVFVESVLASIDRRERVEKESAKRRCDVVGCLCESS